MRAAFAFGVCLLLFGLFGDEHGLRAMLQAQREADALAGSIEALRAENATLRRRADALRRDPAAIEAVARETLGMMRPGEILVTRPAPPPVPLP
jgi:cell division protein FtsB